MNVQEKEVAYNDILYIHILIPFEELISVFCPSEECFTYIETSLAIGVVAEF